MWIAADPKSLAPNTEVTRFWPLFHDSNIPSFHFRGIKPVSLKAAWFQYIIQFPRWLSIDLSGLWKGNGKSRAFVDPAVHTDGGIVIRNNGLADGQA